MEKFQKYLTEAERSMPGDHRLFNRFDVPGGQVSIQGSLFHYSVPRAIAFPGEYKWMEVAYFEDGDFAFPPSHAEGILEFENISGYAGVASARVEDIQRFLDALGWKEPS